MKAVFEGAGLFASRPLKMAEVPLVPQCGACGLYKACRSPKMPVSGEGRREILIVGEAPGRTEDRDNIQFCGDSGNLLQESLSGFGIDMRRDCWITNALICWPGEGNKIKDAKSVDYCRPNLIRTIEELKPKVIIPLGAKAVQSLIGWVWRRDVGLISRWDGWRIPCQKLRAWICPTWHPAYILRSDYGVSRRKNDVRKTLFDRHLKTAVKLADKRRVERFDYASRVKVVHDPNKAADWIEWFMDQAKEYPAKPVAFDLECTGLKPDHSSQEIYSCAIGDGETAIAFPWHGEAIAAVKEFFVSRIPKIGYNLKYEVRWIKEKLGVWVRNWVWDGMVAAHVLDNRPRISGLEFQSFVLLGVGIWDRGVSEFLKAKYPNDKNRIKEAELQKVLLYNGIDALLSWHVARKQMKMMGCWDEGTMGGY